MAAVAERRDPAPPDGGAKTSVPGSPGLRAAGDRWSHCDTRHVENAEGHASLVVVAAAIVADRGLLLVSKQAAPDVFFLPGGKPEHGETEAACLSREIAEELDASVETSRLFAVVSGVAALEGMPLEMTVYLTTLDGEPRAASEIAALMWFSPRRPFTGVLAPAVADSVVPALVAAGVL